MPDEPETSENLNIRCPSCRQRFSVDSSLMERMVECGSCDARFRINDDVIMRSKKFYPGERNATELNRFQRVPLSAAAPEGLQTMRYAEFSNPEQLGPVSPQRVIAGIIGVATMVIVALLLIFSDTSAGTFGTMPLVNKLIVAGFVSVIGTLLLVYANPSARAKAAFFGLLLAGGLISLPFFVKGVPNADDTSAGDYSDPIAPLFPADEEDPLAALKERFTTKPLEAEQARIEKSGTGQKAYGIYLTGMLQRNIYTVRDYLIRDTNAGPSSHPYPRDEGDYLMILTDVSMEIEEVARIAGRLGKAEGTYPEIGVIVVRVDNEQFVAGSADKLNDREDPAFYDLNQRELQSLDMDRVKSAVERLADSKPVIYRDDISRTLTEIMGRPGIRFHDEIARALIVWSEKPGEAGEAALRVLRKKVASGENVSENLVALVAKEQPDGAIPVINSLWVTNPVLWDGHYVKFGPAIELGVLARLASENTPLRQSAIKLLERVGTEKSVPALRKLIDSSNVEVRILAERAISKISSR
jgi:hypothetical protein